MRFRCAAVLAVLGAAALCAGTAAYAQDAAPRGSAGEGECRAGLEPMLRAATGSPACVTPASKAVLIERGWGVDAQARQAGGEQRQAGGDGDFSPDLTAAERAWLDENPVITVAYENRPPIEYLGGDGRIGGLAGIYADRFEEFTGARLSPVLVEHRTSYVNSFRDDGVHLAFTIVETDDLYQHSNIMESHTILAWDVVALRDGLGAGAGAVDVRVLENAGGLAVGTIRGHEIEDWLDAHHPGIDYVSIDGIDNAFDAMLTGRIDVLMEAWIVVEHAAALRGIEGLRHVEASDASMPLSVAFNRDYPVLGGIVGKAMRSIPEDVRESSTREILGDIKFTLDERARVGLTHTERAWLDDNPTIYISYMHWPPIEYSSGDGGLGGLTAMYEERLEAYTGADFVPKPAATWTDVLSSVAGDHRHTSLIMVETTERLRGYTFTSPHSVLEWNIITRQPDDVSTDDLAGMRVGTIRGYSVETWLDEHHPHIDYVSLDTIDRAIASLDSGRIDALIEWWPAISHRAAELGAGEVHNSGAIEFGMPLSAAVAKDNVILRDILDKAIASIPAEERAAMLAAAAAGPPL